MKHSTWARRVKQHGTLLLMGSLILAILCSPAADALPRAGAALATLILMIVLGGASLEGNRRIVLRAALPISGVWLLARLLEEFGNGRHFYDHAAHAAGLALSCTLLWALFDRNQGRRQITPNVVAESVIGYLMIAIAFSQLYWILNQFGAEPFNPTIHASNGTAFLYFSMITLTGVGYGGIVPVSPFVRMVAAFESMAGIFYVTLVVARLVSAWNRPSAFGEPERDA